MLGFEQADLTAEQLRCRQRWANALIAILCLAGGGLGWLWQNEYNSHMLSEARTRRLLAVAPVAIIVCNARSEVLLCNSEAEEMFGYSFEELRGNSVDILMSMPEQAAHSVKMAGAVKRMLDAPEDWEITARVHGVARNKLGAEFPVDVHIRAFRYGDSIEFIAAIASPKEQSPQLLPAPAARQQAMKGGTHALME